jgi:hypothetical protein
MGENKDMEKEKSGAGAEETYKSASVKLQLRLQRWEQHRTWEKANFPFRTDESSNTGQNILKNMHIRILQFSFM